jgi:hypothetical protein
MQQEEEGGKCFQLQKSGARGDPKQGCLEFSSEWKWRRRQNYDQAIMPRPYVPSHYSFSLVFVNSNSETASWVALGSRGILGVLLLDEVNVTINHEMESKQAFRLFVKPQ